MSTEISLAEIYLQHKGWKYQHGATGQLNIWECPMCGKDNWHFYIATANGLWHCKVCDARGNLNQLKRKLGDEVDGMTGVHDYAMQQRAPAPMPDPYTAWAKGKEDLDVCEYLIKDRGFTPEVIEERKLGVITDRTGRKWILIPYFYRGNYIFCKQRSIPPSPKEFFASAGRELPLYNEDILDQPGERIIITEGEMDAISLMSNGIKEVVAVPGANLSKLKWLQKFDEGKRKVYLCYDTDKVGQNAAREMAGKIGLDKCFNVVLPAFESIEGKPGKDINEWLCAGHNIAEFEVLLKQAKQFQIEYVIPVATALDKLRQTFELTGGQPALKTPWASLDKRLGGLEYGDLVGVIAEGKVGKTTFCLNWLDHYWDIYKLNCFFYCLEMPDERLARKWVSYVTNTPDSPDESLMTTATVDQAIEIALKREGDFFFGYHHHRDPNVVFNTIRQVVRCNNVKVVVFDNLQYLVKGTDNLAQEVSNLTKMFKELCMELKIVIFLIIQPRRVNDGEMVSARHSYGSSAIEKDCDAILALHRRRLGAMKEDQFSGLELTTKTFDPHLRVTVDLSRYAPGGITTLLMEGECSRIRELTKEEVAQAQGFEGKATVA